MNDKNTIRLLALDASSTTLGYVLYDGRVVSEHGTYCFPGDLLMRLSYAEYELTQLIQRLAPDAIAYEGPAWAHRNTAIACLQMLGVLRLAAHRAGVLDLEIAPNEGKRALFGKGKADKEAMIRAAAGHLAPRQAVVVLCKRGTWGGYIPGVEQLLYDEHAADALGVAMAAHGKVKKEGVAA